MTVNELLDRIVDKNPGMRQRIEDARAELKSRREQMGDDAFYEWLAGHFVSVGETRQGRRVRWVRRLIHAILCMA